MGLAHSMLKQLRKKAEKNEVVTPEEKVLALRVCRSQGVFEASIRQGKHATPMLAEVIDAVPGGYQAIPPADAEIVTGLRAEATERRGKFWEKVNAEKAAKKAPVAQAEATGASAHAAAIQSMLAAAAR